ncbi:16S rRNA (guanine(527)-N(7))-methyltransferase RsmG [Roseofilum reptotaenium CS-1145]|uniref:Ribosomal RNA small subunit methyltransferase G n=1 Tax=Roseofilum reptotaenium AO1-A TaxID=1925591 RepID=A0A1L9QS34_9CYAN|nr:16S rRNA (guanine(527)-N(7))-methyltransferase RsmG [Roseofilum reptotaenium]MDB9515855.1 16S rRNA (guanine(527)-N(7))-methyltransferase RsmG [Roseofilum reptotaenium CS-1145]OJJ25436.1 16S rRNA (guanine(527)-N(7))-methyltransferase RsmG [Roseofilum reptotaenium AO1-A]
MEILQSIPPLPPSLEIWQQTMSWQPTPSQLDQFQQLYGLILAGNRHMNLTRITEPTEFWEKHLWDSIRPLAFGLSSPQPQDLPLQPWTTDRPLRGLDIGTGGGFPGFPVAFSLGAIYPQLELTLLDSTQKKILFLEEAIATLKLPDIRATVGRAEQIHHQPDYYQQYDFCLIRAVANAEVCVQYAFPFLKPGGLVILYRGRWTQDEEKILNQTLRSLRGNLIWIDAFITPLSQATRHCIYVRKECLPLPVTRSL